MEMSKKPLKIEFFNNFDQHQKKQDQDMLALSMSDRIRLAVELIKRMYGNIPTQSTPRKIQIISS